MTRRCAPSCARGGVPSGWLDNLPSVPPTDTPKRFPWVDAVRGACVLAVVLLHFSLSGFYPYLWGTRTSDAWVVVNDMLTAVRMPTLFAVSGFVLSSRIREGWGASRTRYSVAHSYYLYAVWLVIYTLVAPWFPTGAPRLTDTSGWTSLAQQLVLPRTMLWFVLGLAFWTAVLATARRIHAWVILAALFGLTMLSFTIEWETQTDFYIRVLRYGFYFAVGVYLRPMIERLIGERMWWSVAASAAAFVGFHLLLPIENAVWLPIRVVAPLRDLAAVGLSMSIVAAAVTHFGALRKPLTWVGKRTLPIYVLHSLVIWTLIKLPGWGFLMRLPVHKHVAPALWAVIVALICVGVYSMLMRTPARCLFEMPAAWRTSLRKEQLPS